MAADQKQRNVYPGRATLFASGSEGCSMQSEVTSIVVQGPQTDAKGFRRCLERSKSITSPQRPSPQKSSKQKHQAPRVVTLKPPQKNSIPGRAPRLEPSTSTFSRETEVLVLNKLFDPRLWQPPMSDGQSESSSQSFQFESLHAQVRCHEESKSLWARACSDCKPEGDAPFTPLAERIQAQKRRRLEQKNAVESANHPEPFTSIPSQVAEIQRVQSQGSKAKTTRVLSSQQGTQKQCFDSSVVSACEDSHPTSRDPLGASKPARQANCTDPDVIVVEDEEEVVSMGKKKILSASEALQVRALKEELRAAEGTVAELKQLIADIENG